jgi:hypothetical protein
MRAEFELNCSGDMLHYKENYILSNTNHTKNWELFQVLRKDKHFLLH